MLRILIIGNRSIRLGADHRAHSTTRAGHGINDSTGRQYALENREWGNGAFTRAVLEGIAGKADDSLSGRITLNMLDLYVSERVKELTRGQQTPTTVKPPNVPDFPVAMLR